MKRILFVVFFMAASGMLVAQRNCGQAQYATAAPSLSLPSATAQLRETSILPEVITIPVIVHVVYNTAQQNISDEQVYSQIEALNKDYRGTNADRSKTPSYFAPFAADCGIMFRLAQEDAKGNPISGIIRKQTGIKMFGVDDRIKSSAIGGDDAWNRNKYLNIWVCNMAGGILGYTSLPGEAAEKDGVVIHYAAFGTTANVAAPFNKGRTATHEIGHWLNLRHIWGDDYCGDDAVDDTPTQRSSNRGCPQGEKFTCGATDHGDMYMNFMDLTDDACMFMFTEGQKRRMRALFQSFGFRHEMLVSEAVTETGTTPTVVMALPTEISVSRFAVYPNPASTAVTVAVTGNALARDESLNVYNAVGQQVVSMNITASRTTVNISRLTPGLYFIKLGSIKHGPMVKFVKN